MNRRNFFFVAAIFILQFTAFGSVRAQLKPSAPAITVYKTPT